MGFGLGAPGRRGLGPVGSRLVPTNRTQPSFLARLPIVVPLEQRASAEPGPSPRDTFIRLNDMLNEVFFKLLAENAVDRFGGLDR